MAASNAMSTSNQFVVYQIVVTQNSQSIENNTSNVTVQVSFWRTNTGYQTWGTGTVYCKINGTTYTAGVSPSQYITSSGIILFAKTLNIPHNSDGTKTLTCSAWISHDAPLTSNEQSFSCTLTTIPRKSSLSVANGTLNTAQTLTVTRKSTSFTHTITATCSGTTSTICTKSTSTSLSFTPPLSWAAKNTTGTSVSVTYKIETVNGSTSIGSSSYTVTCSIPASVKPTASIAVSDAAGYSGTYSGYVKTKSKVKCIITASGAQGSTIKTYSTVVNGKTYTGSTITTDVLNASGTMSVQVTVTDSRGRTATASTNITVLDYTAPAISSMTVQRANSDGTLNSSGSYLKVTFNAAIISLNSKNTAKYTVKYKKSTESTYSSATVTAQDGKYSVTNGSYVFAADTTSSYNVILEATDAFSTTQKTGTGGTINSILSILAKGTGLAIGKIAELANYLDVKFKAIFRDTVEINGAVTMKAGANITGTTNVSGTFKATTLNDPYGQPIRNGMTAYATAGLDPNTTLEHAIVTDKNTPSGKFMYIITFFYSSKATGSNRFQIAYPYLEAASVYQRVYYNGKWLNWVRQAHSSDVSSLNSSINTKLPLSGGTMTGALKVPANDSITTNDGRRFVSTQTSGRIVNYMVGSTTSKNEPYIHTDVTNQGTFGISMWASDKRLKENFEDSSINALNLILKITHRAFNFIDSNCKKDIGYVAQELENIYEDFVLKVPRYRVIDGESYFTGDYTYQISEQTIIPCITKAIQELYHKIEDLEKEISVLKGGE